MKRPPEKAEVTVPLKANETELNDDLAAMREATEDEIFLADLKETMEDFHHVDIEHALA